MPPQHPTPPDDAPTSKPLTPASSTALDVTPLYAQVREIVESARRHTARSINIEMVRAYWLIGQAIVEQGRVSEVMLF